MSLIKLIDPAGWDFGSPRSQLVKVSSRGLIGQDRREFLKVASHEFVDLIDKIQVKLGEVPIHEIAMGSTEGYGCFFAGTPLQTYDGLQPIEAVEVGDLVLTHRNRFREVLATFRKLYRGRQTEIRVQGLPDALPSTALHPYLVVRRERFGSNQRCPCRNKTKPGWTKQAAVRAAVNEAEWVAAKDIRKGDFVVNPCRPQVPLAEVLPADLAYPLGVYLAEGRTASRYRVLASGEQRVYKDRRVIFSMALNDHAVISRMADIAIDRGFDLDQQPSRTSEQGWRVTWNSRYFAELCQELMQSGAGNKRLSPELFAQSDEWKLNFLAGYFDGDGCLTTNAKYPRYENTLRANTASRELALDIQRLLASLLIPASISRSTNKIANGCFGQRDFPIFEISVGSAYSGKLTAHCSRCKPVKAVKRTSQSSLHTCGDYLLMPVTEVSCRSVEQEVFNLEVEDDNSYVCTVGVHNSNRNGDGWKEAMLKRCHPTFVKFARSYRNHQNKNLAKSYGYVKASAYNNAMRRVELLTMLNETKEAAERNGGLVADRELEKLARGEDLCRSMAARVPFDVCSSCGHQSRTRDEYCTEQSCLGPHGEKRGGCRHNLTKMSADGHVLHVDNPDGVFFDISDVFRPADRIAYGSRADYLQKAASHQFLPGAELAEALGVTAPLAVILAQDDPFGWSDRTRAQIKLAHALAELERRPIAAELRDCFHPQLQGTWSEDQLHWLGPVGSQKSAARLGLLADNKILLGLNDFASWTGRQGWATKAATYLPRVYTHLLQLPDWERRVSQHPFQLSAADSAPLSALQARQWREKYSLDEEACRQRRMRGALRRYPSLGRYQPPASSTADSAWTKQAEDAPQAKQLALDYGLYKLAGLARIAGFDQNFPLTVHLAMAQNCV